jgi:hypothetical protein
MTTTHHHRCIENARLAIAENNGWTLADDPSVPESDLVSETADMALVWLAEGNVECYDEGDLCQR